MKLDMKHLGIICGTLIGLATILGYMGHKEFADKEKNDEAHASLNTNIAVIQEKLTSIDKDQKEGFSDVRKTQREILRKLK